MSIRYSIIIPCYNEEAVLQETHRRLTAVMRGMQEPYELVYVNDCSRDDTPAILDALAAEDPAVKVVHFARNGGHQVAVSAGIDYATGDALVIIDADLQDPPELIPEMAALWREGAQVVYGQRRSRAGETAFKKKTAELYYGLMQRLTNNSFPRDTGDFRLVDRQVADVIRRMPERARYLRGMFAWAGFKQQPILYDRDKRFAGETHYPLKKMLKLAADGLLSFSDKPLKLALWLGAAYAALGLLLLLVMLVIGRGFSLAALVLLMGGSLHLCIGILGQYLARIYDEAKGRPLYVVARTQGFRTDNTKKKEQTS